jgi:hypothetical protein
MEKEFVPYEQTSSLIALGFNEPVIAHRQDGLDICLLKQPEVLLTDLSMILFQQAFRWFREKYGYLHHITYFDPFKAQIPGEADYQGLVLFPHQEVHKLAKVSYDTYEEVELECLKKLIEIVESK